MGKKHKNKNTVFIPSNKHLSEINSLTTVDDVIKEDLIECHKSEPLIKRDIIMAIKSYEESFGNYQIGYIDDFIIYRIDVTPFGEMEPSERRDYVISLLEATYQEFDKNDILEFDRVTLVVLHVYQNDTNVYDFYHFTTVPKGNNQVEEIYYLV